MIIFESLLAAQANSIRVLNESKMPLKEQDAAIKNLSIVLQGVLNIEQQEFNLNDDEVMSLLTLIIIRTLELNDR